MNRIFQTDICDFGKKRILVGHEGEQAFTSIIVDCSSWLEEYPNATINGLFERPDGQKYPLLLVRKENTVVWKPSLIDTNISGYGRFQLQLTDGEVVGKSSIAQVYIQSSISGGEVPEDAPDWVQEVLAEGNKIENMGATASYSEDGGEPSVTVTKTDVGENFSLDFDFANLRGEKGEKGDTGDLVNIASVTASVNNNSGIPSVDVTKGGTEEDVTFDFAFKNLKGNKGEDGAYTESIVKTSSQGKLDTYTMTMSDGRQFEFTVKNGEDGIGAGDMLVSDYDSTDAVRNAGGIPSYVANQAYTKAQTDSAIAAHHDDSKQDVIEDLDDIRTGAELGATAVRPSELGFYRTASEQSAIDDTKANASNVYNKTEIDSKLNDKQGTINDLATIRSGASLGATSLQASALTPYRTASSQDSIDEELSQAIDSKADASSVYTKTEVDTKLSGKQGTIADLSTIRSGASLGATALQPSALNGYRTSADQDAIDETKADASSVYTKGETDSAINDALGSYRTSSAQDLIDAEQNTAIGSKVDKVQGYGLSKNDFTDALKTKLENIVDADLTPYRTSADQDVIDNGIKADIEAIQGVIPSTASSTNQLADKDFVNSSIGTNTANYISKDGLPFNSLAELQAYSGTVTNNDYAFVTGNDTYGNTYFDRYKASVSGSSVSWAKEYRLNNSSFTAEQWASVNSGIDADTVAKIGTNESAISSLTNTVGNKVDKVSGKGLSTNDFTTTLKNKLDSLENADLTPYRTASEQDAIDELHALKTELPTKVSDLTNDSGFITSAYHDSSKQDVITNLRWIQEGAELGHSSVQPSDLQANYRRINEQDEIDDSKANVGDSYTKDEEDALLSAKQDTISDLSTIRSNASLGASAVQPSALNSYRTSAEQDTIDSSKANASNVYTKSEIDTTVNGLNQSIGAKADASTTYTKTQVDTALSGKQATISDLATIRSGASSGATALQPSALNSYRTASAQDTIDNGKQATISDLATIRTNASNGNSALTKVNSLTTDITEIKLVDALPSDASSHPKTLYLVKE